MKLLSQSAKNLHKIFNEKSTFMCVESGKHSLLSFTIADTILATLRAIPQQPQDFNCVTSAALQVKIMYYAALS